MRTFGAPVRGVAPEPRRAAYAVIRDRRGLVAVVRTARGYFPAAAPTKARLPRRRWRARSARASPCNVPLTGQAVEAVQYFAVDGRHYRMEAAFLGAEFQSGRQGRSEHALRWVRPARSDRFFHESHAAAGFFDARRET